MNVLLLVPGTGNFHCGSCMRDHTLVKALRRAGVDAHSMGLYLPDVGDEDVMHEQPAVYFGGINVYLQQKWSVFRRTPRWVDALFDGTGLRRWAAGMAGMTSARDLGELTVSMLRGEHGKQRKELERLIAGIRQVGVPDVVMLNNAALTGLARQIKRELGCKVVCTLHGEDTFLDSLTEGYREQAWGELRLRAAELDALTAVSRHHRDVMAERLGLPPERIDVVHNGIDIGDISPAERDAGAATGPPTLGYMARMCEAKGLHTLIDAFIELKNEARFAPVKLHVAGAQTKPDQTYVDEQRTKLTDAGWVDDVTFEPNVSRARKVELLRSCDVFSVPAGYGESFGLYVLEAWAAGVPVVEPDHAGLGELLDEVEGGIAVAPNDAGALAKGLAHLLDHPDEARQLGANGRQAVMQRFTDDHMAAGVIDVLKRIAPQATIPPASPSPAPPAPTVGASHA